MSSINDILIGLSSTLPNGESLPSNLWIVGTRSKDRAMDIPKEAIREYGCLKYGDDHYVVNNPIEVESKYITMDCVSALPRPDDKPTSYYQSYLDEEL